MWSCIFTLIAKQSVIWPLNYDRQWGTFRHNSSVARTTDSWWKSDGFGFQLGYKCVMLWFLARLLLYDVPVLDKLFNSLPTWLRCASISHGQFRDGHKARLFLQACTWSSENFNLSVCLLTYLLIYWLTYLSGGEIVYELWIICIIRSLLYISVSLFQLVCFSR